METTKWISDQSHSSVGFKIRHLMLTNVKGNFNQFQAEINMPGGEFEKSEIKFSAAIDSIDTKSADRDKHLKSADFFDAEQFPHLEFTSTAIAQKANGEYTITGDLKLHGITKSTEVEAEFGGFAKDPWGTTKAGLNISGKLNRKDWGLNWNSNLETGGVLVSEEVKLEIELQLIEA